MVHRLPPLLQILGDEVRCMIYFSAYKKLSSFRGFFLRFISAPENFFIYLRSIFKNFKTFFFFLSLLCCCYFPQLLQISHNISALAVSLVYFRIFPDYLGNPQDLHTAVILNHMLYKPIQTKCLFHLWWSVWCVIRLQLSLRTMYKELV